MPNLNFAKVQFKSKNSILRAFYPNGIQVQAKISYLILDGGHRQASL